MLNGLRLGSSTIICSTAYDRQEVLYLCSHPELLNAAKMTSTGRTGSTRYVFYMAHTV
ncbi:hypothetical protein BIW11_11491 [Tropilaelaps mercedesae]|uniref:Uncharacterized protein n=1 Tax=Tropilaelaps mercedesae TaxID=418985 RepID=A0A1V9XB76_9ACAR|nr:hypothetical protein BIW11_11491 [Tropilaelaps mercedesae]